MSYAYKGIATTQTGTIIYKRKKHLMTMKDLRRLIKKLGYPETSQESYFFILAAMDLLVNVAAIPHADVADNANLLLGTLSVYVADSENFPGFSGGEFGGAGATGTFWKPFDV